MEFQGGAGYDQSTAGERGVLRSIGGIVFDVTISENQTDTLTITDHPVQTGATISDHAYVEPREVTIVVGKGAVNDEEAPREWYDKLKELQAKREPFEIITGKDEYENMLIKSISVMTDMTTENVLVATVVCREVILVETQEVAIAGKSPSKANQGQAERTASTQNSGAKQVQPTPERGSTLFQMSQSFRGGG